MKVDPKQVADALQTVNLILPQLGAAYAAYRLIWTAVNPGKTEQEYLDHLTERSQNAVNAADAILLADGFTQNTDGSWKPPVTP